MRCLDQTLVYMLIFAAIVGLATIAIVVLPARRHGARDGARDVVAAGILAAVPGSSPIRPSTLLPKLSGLIAGPSAMPDPIVPSPRPSDPTSSSSRLPTDPLDLRPPEQDGDPIAQPTNPLIRGKGPEVDYLAGEPSVDAATGFATRRAWDDVFRHEEHQFARYGHPVTVLLAELEGLDSLASLLGQDAADRLIVPVATAMRRSAREADFLARTGHARFAALLPETDEVAAINYAERVCSACDLWLEAGGVGVRLAIGWAQPVAGGSLSDAMCIAYDRMNANRHRKLPRPAPSTAVPPSTEEDPSTGTGNRNLRDGSWTRGFTRINRDRGGHTGDAA
jgi:diguanylate cyclase (GGDEF)-like protein